VFGGELAQAEQAAGKAIELSPSFALGHFALGMARLFSGQAATAIEPLEHGVRLSPFDPHDFVWFQVLALAHYFSGQREVALEMAQRAASIRPSSQPTLERVAFFQAALGRIDEARAVVARMRQLERPPADVLAPLIAHNPPWQDEIAATLRMAGWPA
jgi:tetratricopeptide (TPR) repeat protein